MKTSKNLSKFDTFIVVSVSFLLIATLYVAATGYTSGTASHTVLFADTIRGKSGNTVYVDDNLTVSRDIASSRLCLKGECKDAWAPTGTSLPVCTTGQLLKVDASGQWQCADASTGGGVTASSCPATQVATGINPDGTLKCSCIDEVTGTSTWTSITCQNANYGAYGRGTSAELKVFALNYLMLIYLVGVIFVRNVLLVLKVIAHAYVHVQYNILQFVVN
jgi:hypothetical protein